MLYRLDLKFDERAYTPLMVKVIFLTYNARCVISEIYSLNKKWRNWHDLSLYYVSSEIYLDTYGQLGWYRKWLFWMNVGVDAFLVNTHER
jgi:hypothetical protein